MGTGELVADDGGAFDLAEQILDGTGVAPGEQFVEIADFLVEIVVFVGHDNDDILRHLRLDGARYGEDAGIRHFLGIANIEVGEDRFFQHTDSGSRNNERPKVIPFARFINAGDVIAQVAVLIGTFEIFAGAGVDLDQVTFLDEGWNLDFQTGLDLGGFGDIGHGVSTNGRFAFNDAQDH